MNSTLVADSQLRQIQPQWDPYKILASIAISLLGSFTACQLVCQARASIHFSATFSWSVLGSLIFGFCGVWSLHEVAMLAYEFDLPMGVDPMWTIVSAVLAVGFTFVAMTGDLIYQKWRSRSGQRSHSRHRQRRTRDHLYNEGANSSSTPLLAHSPEDEESIRPVDSPDVSATTVPGQAPPNAADASSQLSVAAFAGPNPISAPSSVLSQGASGPSVPVNHRPSQDVAEDEMGSTLQLSQRTSSESSTYRRYSGSESTSSFGLRNMIGLVRPSPIPQRLNIFASTINLLYVGLTIGNIVRGFTWSLALFAMHYTGIWSLHIPNGYYKFDPRFVVLSEIICWVVCTIGFILMSNMETYLPQQIVFSVVATSGVAAMHWCGMLATSFWTRDTPSDRRGFPPALIGTTIGIAFLTCMIANVLLSHSATLTRNKLAEIVWTRKQLFKNIAAKEHAEAAARARSEFIASASHEIRTPLHHLQGYSDLLSQTELTEEGRTLLVAIQRATKTLSLLTNNVLDWSKFEGNANGQYLPTPVDVRVVCESIITLLPNLEDESQVEIYVAISPNVPKTLSLDESWIHRILMNLLSNALKFTKQGYILLEIENIGENLIASISDTGCGLAPEFIPDMWTPFKQGEVRGSARGTGLGLSIVQMLLHRMSGSIEVESQYEQTEGVGTERSGTKFIATIPVGAIHANSMTVAQSPGSLPAPPALEQSSQNDEPRERVAVLCLPGRPLEGLQSAWNTFGYESHIFESADKLLETKMKVTYVWAELDFLVANLSSWPQLLQRDDLLVLVPYDTQDLLELLPGILRAQNFVLLHKPLLWHTFAKRITAARERRRPAVPSRALRFAPDVQILNGDLPSTPVSNGADSLISDKKQHYTILLVEDNPINRKLGSKMLQNLAYKVLLANDGLISLNMLVKHDAEIDCILMDQSMPNMDGVTATRAIRRMEKEGRIRAGRPILAVTAVVNSEAKEDFRQAGADDFMAKPLSLEKLRDVLRVYLPND